MSQNPRIERSINRILGVDEAGRGPLAGPVVAAGVVLDPERPILGLNDSKKLSAKKRESLYQEINDRALVVVVHEISVAEIDQINILQATLKAMGKVIAACQQRLPLECALIDGNQIVPHMPDVNQRAIIKGDSSEECIMAASIIAKVHRDRLMDTIHDDFPAYGFKSHKGYGTKAHIDAIMSFGPTPHHRMSFAPLKGMLWPSL